MLRSLFQAIEQSLGPSLDTVATVVYWLGIVLLVHRVLSPVFRLRMEMISAQLKNAGKCRDGMSVLPSRNRRARCPVRILPQEPGAALHHARMAFHPPAAPADVVALDALDVGQPGARGIRGVDRCRGHRPAGLGARRAAAEAVHRPGAGVLGRDQLAGCARAASRRGRSDCATARHGVRVRRCRCARGFAAIGRRIETGRGDRDVAHPGRRRRDRPCRQSGARPARRA